MKDMKEKNSRKQLKFCLILSMASVFGVAFATQLVSLWHTKAMKRSDPVTYPIDAMNTGSIVNAPMDRLELQMDSNSQSTATSNQTTEAGKNGKN